MPSNSTPEAPLAELRADDVRVCEALLKVNSKTFHAASRLLPRSVREPATVLYGFCRLADDAVDVDGDGLSAIVRLRERLERVYSGSPLGIPTERAIAAVFSRHRVPRAIPELLIEGLEWDARGRTYESLDDLLQYALRVAGTVGAMMSLLMGVRDEVSLARACELGMAMQLTNIARDVGEDARMGRIYLPLRWMRASGIDPQAWLRSPQFDGRIASLIERLLIEADRLYDGVGEGIAKLPWSARPGINAARCLYRDIGECLREAGHDSIARRTVVPGRRKLVGLMRSLAGLLVLSPPASSVPPSVVWPVLSAVRGIDGLSRPAPDPPWWRLDRRLLRVLVLFERLERRDRIAPPLNG